MIHDEWRPVSPQVDRHSGRWKVLAILSLAELMGMSVWFTGSAIAPELQLSWGLTSQEVGWLTASVQLGFVVGTAVAAILNLADLFPSHRYFCATAILAGIANGLLLTAGGFPVAVTLRFFTGFFLAGVYPPAMKMVSTWFRSGRGLAIGTVVGALTVGKATPYLLKALPEVPPSIVVLAASCAAALGGLLVVLSYTEGPFPFSRARFSWGLAVQVLRHRKTRLAVGGYLGHMWELYAMWTWVPAFLLASAEASRTSGGIGPSAAAAEVVAFGAIAAGGAGCVWGGWAADKMGRERVVNLAMAVSGACCLFVGFLFGASFWVLAPLTWIWGFFVVADSAQFSAMVTEVAPSEAVGTALTLQTSLGFLLTMVSIQALPEVAYGVGWGWAFLVLAPGPLFGIASIRRFAGLRSR